MFNGDNYAQRAMKRYNIYGRESILPVHTPSDKIKCKDFDVDKVDFRLGVKLPKIDIKRCGGKNNNCNNILGDANV